MGELFRIEIGEDYYFFFFFTLKKNIYIDLHITNICGIILIPGINDEA